MNRAKIEQAFKSKSLEVEYGKDEPGKVYEPHRHEETHLYTLSGSLRIKIGGNDWATVGPNQQFIVNDGELHEAVVGDEGWEYIAAWDKEQAKKYEQGKKNLF